MGAGHAHTLYHHGHTRVHRLPPEVKVAAAFVFVLGVAVTPRHAYWAFALDALALVVATRAARLPLRFVAARMLVVVPFVAFALLIPFVAGGETIDVWGVSLSRDGALAAITILAKAGLGVTTSIVLAGTTEQSRILAGLERLRVPTVFTTIAAFMLRYLEILADEVGRMRTAMRARGYAPRWIGDAGPVANAAGALFLRSYERGERVHAAMLSRGFTGTMPRLADEHVTRHDWLTGIGWALVPAVVALAAHLAGT
ncbi:MAG: cobalt ECF transporter T component CbiQ [Nitriliruptorales bacterium]|nr:cobalt ECF transporter T component CbiQ [Nitriliruptorales bacterium]